MYSFVYYIEKVLIGKSLLGKSSALQNEKKTAVILLKSRIEKKKKQYLRSVILKVKKIKKKQR
jgi:hypothetical protein